MDDNVTPQRKTALLLAFGAGEIVYLGARMIPFSKIASYFVGGDVARMLNTSIAEGLGSVVIAVVSLLLILLCSRFFYKRGIFVRV